MQKRKALVVGGSNGIGLSIVKELLEKKYEKVYIIDKQAPDFQKNRKIEFHKLNLINENYGIFEEFNDINTLIITAGFGRIAPFESFNEVEIINNFKVNSIAAIRIIRKFYDKLLGNENFYCAVMGSIAGLISSPLFSVYGSAKASLCKFIESVNIELEMKKSPNRILNISPGYIEGTKFYGNENNKPDKLTNLSEKIVDKMLSREVLYIPEYEKTYKDVLQKYKNDPHKFGIESYKYKEKSGRVNNKPQVKIGYLSGTFDLFHIGHLNILRKAKEYCDYLVVGVHKDGSHKNKEVFIPFEERVEIVRSVKYVDEVIQSLPEDNDVYDIIKYDYLFVGSDYKGSERFNRYEEYFKDKDVQIIYFPYTKRTNSTKLRSIINSSIEK